MDTSVKLTIHADLEHKTESMLCLPYLMCAMFSLLTISLQQAVLENTSLYPISHHR